MTTAQGLDARLAEMANTNRALLQRAQRTEGDCPSAVLNLGVAVAALSTQACSAVEINRFLDQAVLDELLGERHSLAEDLELLDSLVETSSKSPDVEPLSTALLRRIEKLLEREHSVLFRPLLRLAASSSEKTAASSGEKTRVKTA